MGTAKIGYPTLMNDCFKTSQNPPHVGAWHQLRPVIGHHNLPAYVPLPLMHKFLANGFQLFSPLYPPILGDFKFRSPPKFGGIEGGNAAF
jgi:hypothetical protein